MKFFLRAIKGVALFLLAGNISAQVEKLDDGVLIHLKGANAKAIKLQVVSDKIIHVITSPVQTIHKDTTLMVIGGNQKATWSIDTKNNETTLSTAALKVVVDLSAGAIKFRDLRDRPLLQEEKNGS